MDNINLKIEQYEGPLDLLLSLIAKHKINIFDIPISEITEQYMEHINSMVVLNMEVTGEFIAMAAELMLIKSKLLLPKQEGEEDPRQPLVDALLEHQRAKLAAEFLKKQSEEYYDRYTKEPDTLDGVYTRLHAVSLLQEAFLHIAERAQFETKKVEEQLFTKIENERYYTVGEKVVFLLRLLTRRQGRLPFEDVFEGSQSRGELVAVFLAVLEAVSKGRVDVEKEKGQLFLLLIKKPKEERVLA